VFGEERIFSLAGHSPQGSLDGFVIKIDPVIVEEAG
jgi:hypothetical protein